ncbi:hypothetical protein [Anaerovorax sp. IOR16]|uniref:hypothetical protein n=1 Tax=Anaerovorax sp. IOR16 TaxID=2773458 RepID=UPI0019D19993|nr:hypothetical protein [Anaerovorax sp. IOR16]
MNIPKKVKIGGSEYVVEWVNRPCESNSCVQGEISYTDTKIRIKNDEGFSQDYKDYIFIHEVLHGLMFHAGLDQDDETVIRTLSFAIHAFIKDNPEIFNAKPQPRN